MGRRPEIRLGDVADGAVIGARKADGMRIACRWEAARVVRIRLRGLWLVDDIEYWGS
jgi:hypothetical protein